MALDVKMLEQLIRGASVEHTENSVSWIFTCPRCNKSKKLFLRKRDGRFVCWRCKSDGYEGRPEYALRDLLGIPVRDIQEKLYGASSVADGPYVKLELRDFFGDDDEIPFDLLPSLPQVMFPEHFYEIEDVKATKGRVYLESRGINTALAKRFDLRYDPVERRVVFPIVVDGKLVGWQARFILPSKWIDDQGRKWEIPKILTGPKSFNRERTFMFQDNLKESDHAVLCEGPVDGVKAHLCGGVIVSMGKALSPGQIEALKDWAEKVKARTGRRAKLYLGVDPDAAAELTRLCREFSDLELYQLLPRPGFEDLGADSPEGVFAAFLDARRINAGRVFIPPHTDFFTLSRTAERPE